MDTYKIKRVTIVTERLLRDRLLTMIKKAGATGYTVTDVRGEGTGGSHATDFEGSHVKIETLVRPPVADQILQTLADDYFDRWAVIAYVVDVDVVRGSKYG